MVHLVSKEMSYMETKVINFVYCHFLAFRSDMDTFPEIFF